jgi:hypothetical protein
MKPSLPSNRHGAVALALLGAGVCFIFTFLRIGRVYLHAAQLGLLLCLLAGGALLGCGGSSGRNNMSNNTPKGAYTITVAATAGATTHSTHFALTIQ